MDLQDKINEAQRNLREQRDVDERAAVEAASEIADYAGIFVDKANRGDFDLAVPNITDIGTYLAELYRALDQERKADKIEELTRTA